MPLDRTTLHKGKLQCVQELPREMSPYKRHAMLKVNHTESGVFDFLSLIHVAKGLNVNRGAGGIQNVFPLYLKVIAYVVVGQYKDRSRVVR